MPDDIARLLHQRIQDLMAKGAPKEDIAQELAWAKEALDAKSAQDPEAQHRPSMVERVLTEGIADPRMLEVAGDAYSLGSSGLIADAADAALSGRTFAGNRAARQERRQSLPAGTRTGAEVAGALASPIGGIAKAGEGLLARFGTGRAARAGAAALDAGAQSGISGTLHNIRGTSPQDVADALQKGRESAMMGSAIAAPFGALSGSIARNADRIRGVKRLDKKAFEIDDRIRAMDKQNYGRAEGEATSTPAISKVLEADEEVAPIARELRGDATYLKEPSDDAQILMGAYRRLSTNQRRAEATLKRSEVGDVGYDSKLSESTIKRLKAAKGRLLDAAEAQSEIGPGIPSLRKAVHERAVAEGEREAFERGQDIAKGVGSGKSLPASRQLTESREAMLRSIPEMTQAEAEAALAGVMGRIPESVHITNSPLGLFGVLSSAARLPMQMYRTGPIIEALERRAGKQHGGPLIARAIRGLGAKTIGAENQP